MKDKKGVSTIVSWVLLLGLSIGLAITVFFWTTRQAEELSESAITYVEGGMQCDNVMINVAVFEDPPDPCKLTIKNTHYLNIEKIILRSLDPPDKDECCEPLNVKTSKVVDKSGWDGRKVEVMPIVKVNRESVGCKNKAITVEC